MTTTAIPQLLVTAFVVSTLLPGSPASAVQQLQTLPGSVVRGERLLTTNRCINCHTLKGKGGKRGPELAAFSKDAGTPALFAASLWNHMPAILAEIDTERWPALAQRFNVMSIPNIVVMNRGQVVLQHAGPADHRQMTSWLMRAE